MERRLAAVMVADMVGYSRLMERAATDLLTRQKAHRHALIDPGIARHGGKIIKTTGDGMLVEFGSAHDAVHCGIEIQTGMIAREASTDPDSRIVYRIGINVGDVIHDGDDIFGDGVNVAARLEALAEPGGLCISDIVHQTVSGGLDVSFRDLGSQRIKNISRPVRVWQWTAAQAKVDEPPVPAVQQHLRFCRSADGTQIAWARSGTGPPVLRAPHWMTHLEYEWGAPIHGPLIRRFAESTEFVRFDQRGNGLSDRQPKEISVQTTVDDMQAVVEAAGLQRFALYGASQGAGFAISYARRFPERVSCMVILGGYARGTLKRNNPEQTTLALASRRMIADGWGSPNPVYRHFFSTAFLPDSDPGVSDKLDELQRVATDTEDALRLFDLLSDFDFVAEAQTLDVPTLVMHAHGDRRVPLDEGRLIARSIQGAEFIELPGNNHILTEGTPAFDLFFDEAIPFIRRHS